VSEAASIGVPMIVELNLTTLSQEIAVARWVKEHRLGYLWSRLGHVTESVLRILDEQKRTNMRRLNNIPPNSAVYEIPGILLHVLDAAASARKAT
jgi:hypothetical protein